VSRGIPNERFFTARLFLFYSPHERTAECTFPRLCLAECLFRGSFAAADAILTRLMLIPPLIEDKRQLFLSKVKGRGD